MPDIPNRCKAATIEKVRGVPTVRRCTYEKGHEANADPFFHDHGFFASGHKVRWPSAAGEMVVS